MIILDTYLLRSYSIFQFCIEVHVQYGAVRCWWLKATYTFTSNIYKVWPRLPHYLICYPLTVTLSATSKVVWDGNVTDVMPFMFSRLVYVTVDYTGLCHLSEEYWFLLTHDAAYQLCRCRVWLMNSLSLLFHQQIPALF